MLIGGVLQSGEVIKISQITRTIADIRGVKILAQQFEEKYGYMPGDIQATTVLPGCNAANFCVNGNENGSIGGTLGVDDVAWTSDVTGRAETIQVWKHLALADMLSTVDVAGNPATPAWASTHPAAPVGGGYEFYYDSWTVIGFSGHILRLSMNGVDPTGGIRGVLTPAQAGEIDRKMDDGQAGDGKVFADYGSNDNDCKTGQVYDENAVATCMLYVVLF